MNVNSNGDQQQIEQPFLQISGYVEQQKSKLIVPYNLTPLVKLFQPVKTKLFTRNDVNRSIQCFNEPAEYSQIEIDLLDISIDKSIQKEHIENYEPLTKITYPAFQETTQYPQLFVEAPLLIPYFMEHIVWDTKMLKLIATDQKIDDHERYNNFYKQFKNQVNRIQMKYYSAKRILSVLIEKYQLCQKAIDLQNEVNNLLARQHSDLEHKTLQELQKKEWVSQEIEMESMRKRIYQFREEGLQLLMLTDHMQDIILQDYNFIERLNELRANLDHSYDLFEEQIIIYIFHDVDGVEKCMQYLIDGQEIETHEIEFFNSIPHFIEDLEKFETEMKYLVNQLRLQIQSVIDQTQKWIKDINVAFKDLQQSVKKINLLFIEMPAMLTKMRLSINQARIALHRIKLPHNNYRSENQEIYNQYTQVQDENQMLQQLITRRIEKADIISSVCDEQKILLLQEMQELTDDNNNLVEQFQLLSKIPQWEILLSKIQLQRQDIWQRIKQSSSYEIQELNKQELKELELKCMKISEEITVFFGQNRIPFHFIKLKFWAEAEAFALKIPQDTPKQKLQFLDSTIKIKIENLLKIEQYDEKDTDIINMSYFNNLQNDTSVQQPEIEQEIQSQFNSLPNLQELLQLNEMYTIWRNMQIAGIYLNDDYLLNKIKENDNQHLNQYKEKINALKIFFCLVHKNDYVNYIEDVITLINLIQSKGNAKDFIERSKGIPRYYKKNLLEIL